MAPWPNNKLINPGGIYLYAAAHPAIWYMQLLYGVLLIFVNSRVKFFGTFGTNTVAEFCL